MPVSFDVLRQRLRDAAERRTEEILNLSESVAANPEPGYREFQTSSLAESVLKRLGLEVRTGLARTGLRADLVGRAPGPVFAVLGEMDALFIPSHPLANPQTGFAHACGHNTHIATMLGAAMILSDARAAEEISGRIAFIACPAEEAIELEFRKELIRRGEIRFLGGKQQMIAEGVFDDVDMAAMIHAGSASGATDTNGTVFKRVEFHGRSTHAAKPFDSVNALSAASLAIQALGLLREVYSADPSVRIHCILNSAGTAVNIIPDLVVMECQLRADAPEKLLEMSARVDRALRSCAEALGGTAAIETLPGYLPMRNDRKLFDVFRESMRDAADDPDLDPRIETSGICTDMGDLSLMLPALHGTARGAKGELHSMDFRIVDPRKACVETALSLALTACRLLFGDAEAGRAIAARKTSMLSKKDCLELLSRLSSSGGIVHA